MKKLFLGSLALTLFSMSIILFQISCKKDAVAQTTTEPCAKQPKLQFLGNGTLYNFDALLYGGLWIDFPYIHRRDGSPGAFAISTKISLPAHNGQRVGTNLIIDLAPISSTLSVGNYPNTPAVIFQFQNNTTTYASSTNYVVNISKIENNKATGTFSGTLTSGSGPMSITQGTFSDIPIF